MKSNRTTLVWNQYRQTHELLSLHKAQLRVAHPETHKITDKVYIDRQFRASLKSKTSLHIEAPLYNYEYTFPASTQHELVHSNSEKLVSELSRDERREQNMRGVGCSAPKFFDSIQSEIRLAKRLQSSRLQHLQGGSMFTKFNFNNGRRSSKCVWVSSDLKEICWAKTRATKSYSKILVKDILELKYGPVSSVLQKVLRLENMKKVRIFNAMANTQSQNDTIKDWLVFSIVTAKRSFDFMAHSEQELHRWLLGLGGLLTEASSPQIHISEFLFRKIRLKFQHSARRLNLTTNAYLRVSFKDAISRAFTSFHSILHSRLSRISSHSQSQILSRAQTPEIRINSRMSLGDSRQGFYTSRSQQRSHSPCFCSGRQLIASNLLCANTPQAQYINQSMKMQRRGGQNSWRSDVGVHPRCFHQDIIRPLSEESHHSMSSSQFCPPMAESQRSFQYPRPPRQPQQTSEKEKVKKYAGRKPSSSNQQNSEPNMVPPEGCIVLGAYNSLNENSTKANSNTESLIGDSHPMFKQKRKALRPPSINLAVTLSDSQSEVSEKYPSEYEMDEQCEESQMQFHLTNKQELQESEDSYSSHQFPRGSEMQDIGGGISEFQDQESFRQTYAEEEEEKEEDSELYSDQVDQGDIPEETDAGIDDVNSLYSEPPASDKRMSFPVETEEREFRGNTEEAGELSNTKRFRQRQKSICMTRPPTYLRKPPRPLTSLGFNAHHHNSQILLPLQFKDISPVNYESNQETHESAGLSRSQLDCLMSHGGVAQRPRSMASGASVPGHQSARKGNDSMIMTQQSHSEEWQPQEVKTERKNPQPLIFTQSGNKAYHYPRPSTGTANFASIPSSRLQTCESVISREPLIVGEEHGGGEAIIRSIETKEQRDDGSVGDIDPISPRDLMMCNSSFSLELPRGETTFDQNKFKNEIRIFQNSGCSLFFQNSTNCVSPSEGGISFPFPTSVESEKQKPKAKQSCAIFCASPSDMLNYNSTGGSLNQVHPESTKMHSFHDRLYWSERVKKLERELANVKQERDKNEAELKAEVARQKVRINRLEDQLEAQHDQNAILRAEASTRSRVRARNRASFQTIQNIVEEIGRMREELRGMKQEVVENSQQVSEVWPHLQNVLTSALAQLP